MRINVNFESIRLIAQNGTLLPPNWKSILTGPEKCKNLQFVIINV